MLSEYAALSGVSDGAVLSLLPGVRLGAWPGVLCRLESKDGRLGTERAPDLGPAGRVCLYDC